MKSSVTAERVRESIAAAEKVSGALFRSHGSEAVLE
jgi:hypothetical protein